MWLSQPQAIATMKVIGNTQVLSQIAVPPAIPIHPRRRLRSGSSSWPASAELSLGGDMKPPKTSSR